MSFEDLPEISIFVTEKRFELQFMRYDIQSQVIIQRLFCGPKRNFPMAGNISPIPPCLL